MLALSLGMLGAVAGAATNATPAAPDPQIQRAQQHQLELHRMQLIDDRCKLLDITSRAALDATAAERLAWLRDKAPQQMPTPADISSASEKANAVDCRSGQEVIGVRRGAWQMRITWALRAEALLPAEGRPQWLATQSPVIPYQQPLQETLAALQDKYGGSINTSRPRIAAESIKLLAKACPQKPHRCPVETAGEFSKDYAEEWLRHTTLFAQLLAKDPDKVPPVPGS